MTERHAGKLDKSDRSQFIKKLGRVSKGMFTVGVGAEALAGFEVAQQQPKGAVILTGTLGLLALADGEIIRRWKNRSQKLHDAYEPPIKSMPDTERVEDPRTQDIFPIKTQIIKIADDFYNKVSSGQVSDRNMNPFADWAEVHPTELEFPGVILDLHNLRQASGSFISPLGFTGYYDGALLTYFCCGHILPDQFASNTSNYKSRIKYL